MSELNFNEMSQVPYCIWEVGGTEYKLRLSASAVVELEKKVGSLYNVIGAMSEDNMPTLSDMLFITHKSMLSHHHGIKLTDVYEMYDRYIDEGGNQPSFMMEVFIPIFRASGFFPKQSAEMETDKEQTLEQLR